ncbi:MAG: cysteine desulfurase-like protein [candidate division KSB1 bacterium]|nr:cysteine desulfurase-like protein [candidate division KSB1 bacterium]MDZ7300529.1 cysteine desulfurase-like protein [candidate division KSB1 bacterium]MDZ7309668.1 cysteine desulfurase-like protein [candidate division KSB1 bacterium]
MSEAILNVAKIRAQFPALQQRDALGLPFLYLDGPGGTQVPQRVIDAMTNYLIRMNSNKHGQFPTSRQTDAVVDAARVAMADFFNASPEEIIFGANMTTLTFHLSRSLAKVFQPGDEIIVTRLDHDANISPWLALQEKGVNIRWWDMQPETCTLDPAALDKLLTPRTKLLAVGYASNAVGTINDVKRIAQMVHAAGAMIFVDAVHYAPHGPIDVRDIDCDFLACSVYKIFGPHVGVLYGRRELLEKLPAYKVRPQEDTPPDKFETGTLNHEGIAGTIAAIEYLADIGKDHAPLLPQNFNTFQGRQRDLKRAMHVIQSHENQLSRHLVAKLKTLPGVKIYGITDTKNFGHRTPTFAIRLPGLTPQEIARRLGEQGIFVWDGNFYALEVTTRLGVEEMGGVVRIGMVHYNTTEEIDRLIVALWDMV